MAACSSSLFSRIPTVLPQSLHMTTELQGIAPWPICRAGSTVLPTAGCVGFNLSCGSGVDRRDVEGNQRPGS